MMYSMLRCGHCSPAAGDVVGARYAHELIEISAGAHRDYRLMTDEHQRTLRLNVCQALSDCGDLRLNLRDQPMRLRLAIDSRTHLFDTGFDLLQRIVADQQHRIPHRIQRANLAHVR